MIESMLLAPVLCLGAELDCVELVPKDTFLYVECTDVRGALNQFSESNAGKMMLDGKSLEQELAPMFKDVAAALGIKQGDVDLPEQAGMSLFVTFDEDLGIEVPGYFVVMGWGENEVLPKALYEDRIRELSADAQRSFEKDELRGREMLVVESDLEMPDFDAAAAEILPMGDWSHVGESLSTQYIIRDEGRIMISSDPIAMDDALHAIDGGRNKSLAENPSYQSLEEMVPEGVADLQVMMIASNFTPLYDQVFAGPAAAVQPMLQELFGTWGGFGLWLSMGNAENAMEGGMNILLDGDPRGLMKLVDISRPGGNIPAYVPAEAVSYSRIDFDFKNLIPTVRQAIAALPEAQAAQVEPMIDQMAPMMQAGLETLGPEIHIFSTPTVSEFEPTRQTIAIPTSDGEAVNQMLAMFAPMAGLVPRDFNGNTIYSDPLDEFNRMAIGVGAGSLLIGDSDGVEAVLRTSGQRDLPQLDRTDVARRVERALPGGELMLWGMVDLVKQAEAIQGMLAMMPMLLANADVDPGELQDTMERGLAKVDADQIEAYFGPFWYYGQSTDKGFQIRAGVMNSER